MSSIFGCTKHRIEHNVLICLESLALSELGYSVTCTLVDAVGEL